MRVLKRQPHEAILIHRDIRIEVLSIHGNQVRLGITAPESVRIVREELLKLSSGELPIAGDENGDRWLQAVRNWLS